MFLLCFMFYDVLSPQAGDIPKMQFQSSDSIALS
jgi:hypothetical protein